jgi:hypothetical protein
VVASTRALTRRVLALIRAWLADDRFARSRLVVATCGAVGERPVDLAGAAVWGLVRAAQAEHPGRFLLADLDEPGWPAGVPVTAEPQVAVRGGVVLAPRLVRVTAGEHPARWDGSVLVTGGADSLGGLVARHLVTEHGVRDLVLAGPRGIGTAGAPELRDELAGLGADVRMVACDAADREALARVLAGIPGLRGVVHTAEGPAGGRHRALDADRMDAVARPKAGAAWNLHELTQDMELTAFVMFSSAAGLFGDRGRGDHAAANAFLDALAAWRHARGLPATSLAWGSWARPKGMGAPEPGAGRMGCGGTASLSVEEGLALFDAGVGIGRPVAVPIRLDLSGLEILGDALPPLLRALVRVRRRAVAGDPGPAALLGMPDRDAAVLRLVRSRAAAVLGHTGPVAADPGLPPGLRE